MITGKTLIGWGFEPGPLFKELIAHANDLRDGGGHDAAIIAALKDRVPPPLDPVLLRTNNIPFGDFLLDSVDVGNAYEVANYTQVLQHMDALMRVPTLKHGAIMPDACPSGSALGTIPVGGVVAAENAIHPDMHSSDVCCSMAITVFKRGDDPKHVLDVAQSVTHFGPGKRTKSAVRQNKPLVELIRSFYGNSFLDGLEGKAEEHFMTQGDGNHFLYLGHLESSGQLALVTHHGSRGLGAQVYKRGKGAAQRRLRSIPANIPSHQAWIEADTKEGQDYWAALQIVRQWTKMNHFAIHDAIAQKIGNQVVDRFWNEHNFVFQRSDGLFYHGKGATPSFAGFSPDDDGRTLIPMNMSEPILICSHRDRKDALGFAPHGAGRNMSRTQYLKDFTTEMPETIDVRFYSGLPDHSELPGAYKSAAAVSAAISRHGLATVEDRVLPYGSIMGGEFAWKK